MSYPTVPGGSPGDLEAMRSELAETGAAFFMEEGDARVDGRGIADVRLVAGTGEREWFTLLNMFRACFAWRLPTVHGALLHAAGVVLDGRAWVLTSECMHDETALTLGRRQRARRVVFGALGGPPGNTVHCLAQRLPARRGGGRADTARARRDQRDRYHGDNAGQGVWIEGGHNLW